LVTAVVAPYTTLFRSFPGYLIGPGGRIDEGEDPLVAAARETYEETGLKLDPTDITLKSVAIHHHVDRGEVWVNFITRTTLTTPRSEEHTSELQSHLHL